MCIFYFWCAKCNSKWLLERDRDHVKKAERMGRPQKTKWHLKFSARYGCLERVDAMVNLSGFYAAVVLFMGI